MKIVRWREPGWISGRKEKPITRIEMIIIILYIEDIQHVGLKNKQPVFAII